ncbi:MAG: hypothetical protein GF419_01075 [Ignavibacteriales bacterium]|nr:hypothetical protein [Ignavibacteriales bacterium]
MRPLVALALLALAAPSALSQSTDWDYDGRRYLAFFDQPTVGVGYGIATPGLQGLAGAIENVGALRFHIGYTGEWKLQYEGILELDEKRTTITYGSAALGARKVADRTLVPQPAGSLFSYAEYRPAYWRAMWEDISGFGHALGGNASATPYYAFGLGATKVLVNELDYDNQSDEAEWRRYDGLRFTNNFASGFRLKPIEALELDLGYEASVVYPRVLFWMWLGSYAIERAGEEAISSFVGKVIEGTPEAAPVLNFLLKGAWSYALHELREENMHWPFETDAPLTTRQFHVGVNLKF